MKPDRPIYLTQNQLVMLRSACTSIVRSLEQVYYQASEGEQALYRDCKKLLERVVKDA